MADNLAIPGVCEVRGCRYHVLYWPIIWTTLQQPTPGSGNNHVFLPQQSSLVWLRRRTIHTISWQTMKTKMTYRGRTTKMNLVWSRMMMVTSRKRMLVPSPNRCRGSLTSNFEWREKIGLPNVWLPFEPSTQFRQEWQPCHPTSSRSKSAFESTRATSKNLNEDWKNWTTFEQSSPTLFYLLSSFFGQN